MVDRSTTEDRRAGRRRRATAVALALLVVAVAAACDTPNVVASGRTLAAGAAISSPSKAFRLEMQADGNLVLRKAGSKALWTSRTPGNAGATLAMRPVGDLAVLSPEGRALWSTPTVGVRGATATLGDDGNLVVRGTAGQPVWATGTSLASSVRKPLREWTTSSQQVVLTKMYEGLVATTPYHNTGGNCTVGYGHLIRAGACTSADLAKRWDADALFAADVADHERRIKATLGWVPVNQREFDALFDFAFNRGSITATSAPNTYAALTATPPRYADVGPGLRAAGDASSLRGLCDRRYDEAEVFEGGRYDKTRTC